MQLKLHYPRRTRFAPKLESLLRQYSCIYISNLVYLHFIEKSIGLRYVAARTIPHTISVGENYHGLEQTAWSSRGT